jgi:hypothetical protein
MMSFSLWPALANASYVAKPVSMLSTPAVARHCSSVNVFFPAAAIRFKYLSGDVTTASVSCVHTFGNLRNEDSHGAQSPQRHRIGRPESDKDTPLHYCQMMGKAEGVFADSYRCLLQGHLQRINQGPSNRLGERHHQIQLR